MLLGGKFPRLFQEAIRYLYGCLHMANHITLYGRMSRGVKEGFEGQGESEW
jgi:hypothetical protein